MDYEYEEPYNDFVLVSWGWSTTTPTRDGILYTIFVYRKEVGTNRNDEPEFKVSCFLTGQRTRYISEVQRTELENLNKSKLIKEAKRKIENSDFKEKLDIKYG